MKKYLRRTLSLLLAMLLVTAVTANAAASVALGENVTAQDTLVSHSTTLSTDVFWSTSYSDFRTENLITYVPNTDVTPIVTYGGILTGCSTISSTAKVLEANGYRVVAGLNGDFYNTTTGLPIGIVVSNGELKSSDGGYYGIGFRADGTAILGKPAIKVSADLGYTSTDGQTEIVRSVAAVNKARVSTGGIYLYTYDFNSHHTTGNSEDGVDVICTIQSGSLSIGGTLTLRVDQIVQTASSTAIGKDQVVLSANSKSATYYTQALLNAPTGGTITLNCSAAEGWEGVQNAVGALYALVQNGSVVSGLPSGANPRTAVGQKADGTLVFYTIDGRQSGYSIGATMSQIAARLIELGCVSALCLDGGGSTTLTVTKPNSTTAKTVNQPSGGSERAVSNQIFLVATNQPSGILDHFYVSADNNYVLAGSSVALTASAVDTNYIPMSTQSYELTASAGTLSGSTLVTPATGGDITVTASGGGKSGSAVIHAVTSPDDVAVRKGGTIITSLNLTAGSSASLSASAAWNHKSLQADAGAFTWSFQGSCASVDSSGKITALSPGTGTLTVTGGGKSSSVAVTVSGGMSLATLDGFESGVPALASYSYGGTLTSNADGDHVLYGRKSAKLDYTIGADGEASAIFATPYAIASAYPQMSVWVWGDRSGGTLTLLSSDGSTTKETATAALDFTGWKRLMITLPDSTASITGFKISGTSGNSGTIYLDQMTATYGGTADDTAPVVTASLNQTDWVVVATVRDAVDGYLSKSSISVSGTAGTEFLYNASTGTVTVALPGPGETHAAERVTITARDASGNLGRASVNIPAYKTDHAFSDVQSGWAVDYVDCMKRMGITNGYSDGTFRPASQITRQEFAVMLYRYLGLDGTQYENTELPFADLDQIGTFALPAIRTLYAQGIIHGTEREGKVYFNPGSSLTRAQAAAMIGRTMEKGYASSTLSFTDSDSIPEYAAVYIRIMVGQGILSGYADGSFRPNTSITRAQMAKILYNLL
jgi:hypothetical protein